MRIRSAPVVVVLTAVLAALALAAVTTVVAVNQPWLGLRLSGAGLDDGLRVVATKPAGPGQAVESGAVIARNAGEGGESIALSPMDLVEEPDAVAKSFDELEGFYRRQGAIADILSSGNVTVSFADGTNTTIAPARTRPLSDLPASYWIQIAVGLAGIMIGMSVWALRPREAGARLLALGSVALVLSAYPSAIYLTRELALPETLFRFLGSVNVFGSLAYAASLFLLFLVYPTRLVPTYVPFAIAAFCLVAWLLDALRIVGSPDIVRYLLVSLLATAVFPAAGVQYWRAAGDPLLRSALRWIGLALAVATSIYLVLYAVPILTGQPSLAPQALAYALALIVYSGVALSILQFRLFDLDRWTFRILSYVIGVLAFVALDLFFVTVIALDYLPAFSLSLAAVALLYLPLRDLLVRWLMPPPANRYRFFDKVVDVALISEGEERDIAWTQLLREAFDPLSIETGEDRAEPGVADDGTFLTVPGCGVVTPRKLVYSSGGRRLFSTRDVELAGELCRMLAHACASRKAHEEGAAEERARIARDAHDNIGAKLLSALHGGEPERKNTMIREALSDLRDIINASAGAPRTVEETLAELRRETAERVSAADLELRWSVSGNGSAGLPATTVHALRSIVREAVSNVIRHAGASAVTIVIDLRGETAGLEIADDGGGFDPSDVTSGQGLESMRSRVEALDGEFAIRTDGNGTRVLVAVPLKGAAAAK